MHETTVIRDKKSGGVVSIEHAALAEYKRRRSKLREKDKRIESLEDRLTKIEKLLETINNNS